MAFTFLFYLSHVMTPVWPSLIVVTTIPAPMPPYAAHIGDANPRRLLTTHQASFKS
jgi:hypothetical protein